MNFVIYTMQFVLWVTNVPKASRGSAQLCYFLVE